MRLVHEEWPETKPRRGLPGDRIRRRFDLAVLTPSQVRATTVKEFLEGGIPASIVIEVGLDDDLTHLRGDAEKVEHREVPAPFLLHLSRLPATAAVTREEEDVVKASLAPPPGCTTVFAHVDPQTGVRKVKHSRSDTVHVP